MKFFKSTKTLLFLAVLAGLCLSLDADAENKQKAKKQVKYDENGRIIKTGLNYGPIPAVAFDADKGFQLGGILNLYDFGDGSTYPNPRQQWYFEASFFTKGSQLYTVTYDNNFSIPGVRISSALSVSNDKAMDFYGYNGYKSFYDFDQMQKGNKGESFLYSPYYKIDRLSALLKCDFTGNIWDNKLFWLAGYNLRYFDQNPINRTKINKGKKEDQMFPDELPTLYEQYIDWGIVKPEEVGKTISSAIRLGLELDTRDKEGAPTRGVWLTALTTLAPKFLGSTVPYYKYTATFRHYVPVVKNDVLTFAYRLHYDGTFGNQAPHYILPFINCMGVNFDKDGMGSYRSVRGLIRNRVVGLDMASYNVELRWRFVNFKLWKQNISFALSAFSDGTMVTRQYDTSFNRKPEEFKTEADYLATKASYEKYMSQGNGKELPHITAGGGLRFIMNENFIICLEYGMPVGKLRHQDGGGAFYINTGYLF